MKTGHRTSRALTSDEALAELQRKMQGRTKHVHVHEVANDLVDGPVERTWVDVNRHFFEVVGWACNAGTNTVVIDLREDHWHATVDHTNDDGDCSWHRDVTECEERCDLGETSYRDIRAEQAGY